MEGIHKMFSIYAKFLTMNIFCREITAQKLTKGNSDIAEWILIQKLVSEKKKFQKTRMEGEKQKGF